MLLSLQPGGASVSLSVDRVTIDANGTNTIATSGESAPAIADDNDEDGASAAVRSLLHRLRRSRKDRAISNTYCTRLYTTLQ